MREHLEHSLRLYDESGADNAYVREIIQTHHEREDGSGYPSHLAGEKYRCSAGSPASWIRSTP